MTVRTLSLTLFIIFPFIAFSQHVRRTPVPLGSCVGTNAEKLYGGAADDYAADIINTSDGGYLIAGYTNSFGSGGFDGYVIKFDNVGAMQWSKVYGGAADDEFTKAKQTADGGYIFGGFTKSYGDPAGDAWLVKTDAAGNLIWSKKYGDGNPWGDIVFDLIQTADGGYGFVGDHRFSPGVSDAMVVRTDATGNLLWAKGFDAGSSDEAPGIAEDNDSLVVTSFHTSPTGYDAVFMKLEETAGNIGWLQSWDFDGRTNRIGPVFVQSDGYLIIGVNSDGYGIANPWQNIIKTDRNGNIVWVQELNTTPTTMNGYVKPTPDGGYVIENDELVIDPNADIHITKVAKDGTVEWSKQYLQPGQQVQAGIILTPDGGYAGLGYTNQAGSSDLLVIKTDAQGNPTSCTTTDIAAVTRNPVVSPQTFTWPSIYDIVFNTPLDVIPTVTSVTTKDSVLCQTINLCLDLHLSGPDSICDISAPQTYKSTRDSGCVTPVQWSIDNTYADIIAQTDSTVQLQFKQPGLVKLHGVITNTCGVVQDSLPIRILSPVPIDLGAPLSFCPGDSAFLNAGSGFDSYAWSTGETSQQIIVRTTGTYWVAAIGQNGKCLSQDTINVSLYPVPVVNLGPDTSICRDSVYRFDAGAGYSSYVWQDGSSNSDLFASLSGTYWVTVTNSDGCSSSDTARILRVFENPKNFLQPTAEVCSQGQQPILVNSTGLWSKYLWSDSSTGRSIVVAYPGVYWLQVANGFGCTARDTIVVGGKVCPLGIFFPSAFSPNGDGNNDVFRAIVYTVLEKFHMEVYDRWGVRVFETSDPNKGWDGWFGGHPQPAGTFVWYAQYRLQGQGEKDIVQKGTLILVR